jgi:hypothetical protein
LKFIDQNMAKPSPAALQHLIMALPEFATAQQQFRKVHQCIPLAKGFVGTIQIQEPWVLSLLGTKWVIAAVTFIFKAIDEPLHLSGGYLFFIDLLLAAELPDQAQLIVLIQNLKVFRQSCRCRVVAQQSMRDAVEGTDPKRICRRSKLGLQPLAHLASRLVRKGHGENVLCWNLAGLYEPADPVNQHASLARPGASQNQHMPISRFDCRCLSRIQPG